MNFKAWHNLEESSQKKMQKLIGDELLKTNPGISPYTLNQFALNQRKMVSKAAMETGIHPRALVRMQNINLNWSENPEILQGRSGQGVTPLDFNSDTQKHFIRRYFGFKDFSKPGEERFIPSDSHRMAKQKELMMQRGAQNEPVIVAATPQGFHLFEGWHRTMNYLLQGAPADQLEMLQQSNNQNLDFSKWKPIQIRAYVGHPRNRFDNIDDFAGTGSFNPAPVKQQQPQFSQPAPQIQA